MAGNVLERLTALSHYYAVVLVPSDAPDIEEQTRAHVAPFERDLEVPHKYYPEPDQVQLMAKQYGVSPTDLEAIYTHWRLEDISENARAGLDERGLYWFDVENPQGRWTAWSVDERDESVAAMKTLDVVAFVIITPDGEWHERPENKKLGRPSSDTWISEGEWRLQFYAIAEQYPTSIPVRVHVTEH
jgi:hypothetical protein